MSYCCRVLVLLHRVSSNMNCTLPLYFCLKSTFIELWEIGCSIVLCTPRIIGDAEIAVVDCGLQLNYFLDCFAETI